MRRNSLIQQSIKFEVTPSVSNASVAEFLGIGLSLILIYSSSYGGYLLSCAIIEHMRWYISVLACLIKY